MTHFDIEGGSNIFQAILPARGANHINSIATISGFGREDPREYVRSTGKLKHSLVHFVNADYCNAYPVRHILCGTAVMFPEVTSGITCKVRNFY